MSVYTVQAHRNHIKVKLNLPNATANHLLGHPMGPRRGGLIRGGRELGAGEPHQQMDRSASTLIDDLDALSLLKETLVVMGNVIGRTPRDFAIGVAPFFVGD